jgi:hypothetical protein
MEKESEVTGCKRQSPDRNNERRKPMMTERAYERARKQKNLRNASNDQLTDPAQLFQARTNQKPAREKNVKQTNGCANAELRGRARFYRELHENA